MRAATAFAILLLAGCSREPDFDERYAAASRQIGTSAKQIDAQLSRQAKEATATAQPPSSLAYPDPKDIGALPGETP